ncbi:MAG: cytochrome c-type biogenesis protein CcmH [Gammaproteobacteria bacterium]|nr:cytochrome c-type biogenesis protein CcmH [Gammaproteobacteria bacterium]
MRRRSLIAAFALLAATAAPALTPEQEARYQGLIDELRCLVCQNQTIADSDAPLAADLRAQVEAQILEGKSDAEIKHYLTARYGDFVLYRPPVKGTTVFLWAGPFVLLAGAALAALLFLRRRRAPAAAAAVDPDTLKKLLDEGRE